MSVINELKPCPFCGESAHVSNYRDESHYTHAEVTFYQIGCSWCGINFFDEEKEEAIEQWNKRSPDYDELKAWLNDEKLYRIVDKLEELQAR